MNAGDDARHIDDSISRDAAEYADTIEDEKRIREFAMMPGFDHQADVRMRDSRHRNRFPAHHAVTDYFTHRGPPNTTALVDVLLDLYNKDPYIVRKVDENGLTPLHIAAECQYADGIKALLALPEAVTGDSKTSKRGTLYEDLKRFDNIKGKTPADLCKVSRTHTSELAFLQMMLGISLPAPASTNVQETECARLLREAERKLDEEKQ